jgi:hypothetical protein
MKYTKTTEQTSTKFDTGGTYSETGEPRQYGDWLQAGVRVSVGVGFFSFHVVQTGSGAHPVSYLMDTGGFFPQGKAARV